MAKILKNMLCGDEVDVFTDNIMVTKFNKLYRINDVLYNVSCRPGMANVVII